MNSIENCLRRNCVAMAEDNEDMGTKNSKKKKNKVAINYFDMLT